MAAQNPTQSKRGKEGITRITVGGFKSIVEEQSIEVRPLTILAGANSSGKSSIMQPLLLLKQTLEAPYDPGALLLNGPIMRFTLVDQLLSRKNNGGGVDTFFIEVEVGTNTSVTTRFRRSKDKGLEVDEIKYQSDKEKYRLYVGMSQDEIRSLISTSFNVKEPLKESVKIERSRCFLVPTVGFADTDSYTAIAPLRGEAIIGIYARQIIHLPGLRGNPERAYSVGMVGSGISGFAGTFNYYLASVIEQWQRENDTNKLDKVNRDLYKLGLTSRVMANPINDAQIEILVNRFPYYSQNSDMINVADVGLGVSQALPVIVALHAANQGQLVYLEQPEIHLHPRAQTAMAEVLADAVLEGKRVVVETHSSLLLLGIQTLVAEGKLPPEMVKLHWFTQQEDGSTKIDSADLDTAGAFGDWPEDFDSTSLYAESRYIDAAHTRLKGK
ncbi:MAG TPA: AAA family ATPase [Ktedonobacteraceae bacterium]|nr:AAA family ATPase [Ktedonobacteraceae bacterium]